MLRINNQMTYYFDAAETQSGFPNDAKDRMQHEFDLIFEEELETHISNL